jgi:serine/threonine-protein kinase
MEYIDGLPLDRWINRTPAPTRQDRVQLAVQIASAIDAAHRNGIIHRDIKPENILVTAAGDAKVLDFGIARAEAGGNLTADGTVVGSPMYMSPEQIQSKPLDRRTDIYSLGAVFYFLFTGVEPFQGKDVQEVLMKHLKGRPRPPHEVDSSIPPDFSAAVLRALDPDPNRRFATAADLAATLTRTQRASVA